MKRGINIVFILVLLFCLLGSMSLLHIGDSTMKQVPVPTQDEIHGGGPVPPGGDCADFGKDYDGNPFSEWPVQDYRPHDWGTISSWFCDPHYTTRAGKWVPHWGIDIGTYWCPVGECMTKNIGGSTVAVTTAKAIVREIQKDCPPVDGAGSGTSLQKCAWPMGNHVIIEALKEEQECSINPVTRLPECVMVWVPSGWTATYMHLNKVENWVVGQLLIRGKKLGEVGNTGASSGYHLHYQINMPPAGKGKAVDPAPSMAKSYSDLLRSLPSWLRH